MANLGLVDKSMTSGEDSAREGNEGDDLGNTTTQTPTVLQEENSRKRKYTSQMPIPRRVKGVGEPQFLSPHFRQFNTSHYTLYDHKIGNIGPPVNEKFQTFAQYDEYTLYMNPVVERVENIPASGVRLDDMTAAFVLNVCNKETLSTNWPAEFDKRGMVRAERAPLGHAAKFWKGVGAVDVDGNVVQEGEEGYYYKWWRGLHCLCGKEGSDFDVYMKRPGFEEPRCPGVGFKVSSRAKIQLPSGDPADPTFTFVGFRGVLE